MTSQAGSPPTGRGTLVVIATYNERENIGPLVTEVLEYAPGSKVLVVDDNSPDGTGEEVRRMALADGRVKLLEGPAKLGLGTAYLAGFREAVAGGFDRMLTMDADFSHHPQHLPAILDRAAQPAWTLSSGHATYLGAESSSGRSTGASSAFVPIPLSDACWVSNPTTAPAPTGAIRARLPKRSNRARWSRTVTRPCSSRCGAASTRVSRSPRCQSRSRIANSGSPRFRALRYSGA